MALPDKRRSTALERPGAAAFSLVEVVLALGLFCFTLVALLGLFQVGLVSARESEEQVQAANLVSQIIALHAAAPMASHSDSVVPPSALTNSYAEAYSDLYVGPDARLLRDEGGALFRISCCAGTNPATGPRTAQVRLVLTWPPQAPATSAAGSYETLFFTPLY